MSNIPSLAHATDRVMAFPRLSRGNMHTNGDTAALYHDDDLDAPAMAMPDGSVWPLMAPSTGAYLTDADASIAVGGGALRIMLAGTLSVARTITLATTSAITGDTICLVVDAQGFNLDVSDGSSDIFTFPLGTKRAAWFSYNGVTFEFTNTMLLG